MPVRPCQIDAVRAKEVARWFGIMLPVYTSIAVFIVVALVVIQQPRTGEMIAATGNTTASDTGAGER